MDKKWTLRELAAEAGVPERTIRFYISRGLVDPPLRAGRGAAYGARHLDRLREIRTLQARGMPLAEISRLETGRQRRRPAGASRPLGLVELFRKRRCHGLRPGRCGPLARQAHPGRPGRVRGPGRPAKKHIGKGGKS